MAFFDAATALLPLLTALLPPIAALFELPRALAFVQCKKRTKYPMNVNLEFWDFELNRRITMHYNGAIQSLLKPQFLLYAPFYNPIFFARLYPHIVTDFLKKCTNLLHKVGIYDKRSLVWGF